MSGFFCRIAVSWDYYPLFNGIYLWETNLVMRATILKTKAINSITRATTLCRKATNIIKIIAKLIFDALFQSKMQFSLHFFQKAILKRYFRHF
ncbi:hypothetical protein ACIQYS_13055 [Psychrobacillus sp. NPDC096426]|uniref:hypothetical protein n=1 Tax=Psychrobacillus sp. NPDC096426 TaxID=3364491 RepID=UPI003807611A